MIGSNLLITWNTYIVVNAVKFPMAGERDPERPISIRFLEGKNRKKASIGLVLTVNYGQQMRLSSLISTYIEKTRTRVPLEEQVIPVQEYPAGKQGSPLQSSGGFLRRRLMLSNACTEAKISVIIDMKT